MKASAKQFRYVRKLCAMLFRDDETRRDFVEVWIGRRTLAGLTKREAKIIIPELEQEVKSIGMKTTKKKRDFKRGRERLVPGGATRLQVHMVWVLAGHRGMSAEELASFLKNRITGGRTGDPAEMTNEEMTAAKMALESMIDRGDVRRRPRTVAKAALARRRPPVEGSKFKVEGNIIQVDFNET